ncbi:hypothetical protein RIF29_19835 [Crotalaria pallida]|uniref:T-complex protein 1 subunit alpha n=1 Tax=Crotalaria pallida TaxID=3830 RepID=A0AAN9F2F1_CROPI
MSGHLTLDIFLLSHKSFTLGSHHKSYSWKEHVTYSRVFSTRVSLVLRGANDYVLDEMDRALHDALSIVKRTLESNTHMAFACPCAVECIPDHFSRVVAGGGAVEAALSVYLEYLATTLGSREQLAIAEFAESLLIIPKVLSVNAAKDATELVAKLRAYHHTAQTKADKKDLSRNVAGIMYTWP